ncbi:MAG: tetratricopeptide repeat protein [Fischerella sp.]|nr:tetratricopeptide repeat protein [Fischerella sp.]
MSFPIKPLGQVLQQADLISTTQIEIALQEQTQAKNVRIGQIFASRGWLKQETADFFAEQWPTLLSQESKQPLGHYLKQAGLLNEHQIKTILYEQREMGLRFGELAVLKGWIKPTTISFFLQHLTSEPSLEQKEVRDGNSSQIQAGSPNSELAVQQKNNISESNPNHQFVSNLSWIHQDVTHLRPFIRSTIKLFKLDRKASRPEILLQKVLSWTGTQPFLTQKLCQLLCDRETFIPAGEEAARVKRLVQTRLLENWETQVAAEHLLAIRKGIVENQHCDPILLLKLYRQVLLETEIPTDHNSVQTELLNIGLVVKQENKLKVANRIYQSVFNLDWVEQELRRLRPFTNNIIKLFKLDQKASRPDILLEQVLSWTGNQPFLTQKLCQLLCDRETFIPAGEEAVRVERLVKTRLLENWEHQAAAEHLQVIRQGLVENQRCNPMWLLSLYKQILQQPEVTIYDCSPVQTELLNLGLVVKQENKLRVANRIYQSVFNLDWVEQELAKWLQAPSSTITIPKSVSAKATPTTTLSEVNNLIANHRGVIFKSASILLAIAALSIVSLNIFRNQQVKNLFQQGNKLFHQGEYKKAIAKFDQLLNIDSNYYQAWTNRGYALAGLQEYNKMLESCSTATIIEPKAVYAWNCQGEALHNLKQYYEAISAFDKAIALDSQDPVFWINKTESLIALKQSDTALITIDEAIDLLQKIHQAQKVDEQQQTIRELAIAFSHKGKVLAQKQQYKEALAAYDRALIYDPRYFAAQRGRGVALQNLQRYKEAIAQFQQMLKDSRLTDTQKAETWYYLGLTFCNSSQIQDGFAALEAALKLKPDYQAAEEAKTNCSR